MYLFLISILHYFPFALSALPRATPLTTLSGVTNPDTKTIIKFREKIGSLIYAMKQFRLDIAYPLGVFA